MTFKDLKTEQLAVSLDKGIQLDRDLVYGALKMSLVERRIGRSVDVRRHEDIRTLGSK